MSNLEVNIEVLQADGLAVKDTNFLGIPTSSDPYIEVRFKPAGPATPEGDVQFLGKTPVIRKTVAPKWDGLPPFTCQMPIDKLKQDACFELTVMDWDKMTEDDLMGVVHVYVHPERTVKAETKWHGIPATSAAGDEATGRIQATLMTRRC